MNLQSNYLVHQFFFPRFLRQEHRPHVYGASGRTLAEFDGAGGHHGDFAHRRGGSCQHVPEAPADGPQADPWEGESFRDCEEGGFGAGKQGEEWPKLIFTFLVVDDVDEFVEFVGWMG